MYYLGSDNCVYTEAGDKLLCKVSDFEVSVNKTIHAIEAPKILLPNEIDIDIDFGNGGTCSAISGTLFTKCIYKKKRGITLIKDEPIFIEESNLTSATYGS